MAEPSNALHGRFRAERQFGLAVGGVLSAMGAWWLARGRFGAVAPVTVLLGGSLLFLGGLWPRALRGPRRAWMALAEGLSFVSTRVILGAVFFLLLTPIGLAKRAAGWDPLRRRAAPASSYWHSYPQRQRDPRHYEKMY